MERYIHKADGSVIRAVQFNLENYSSGKLDPLFSNESFRFGAWKDDGQTSITGSLCKTTGECQRFTIGSVITQDETGVYNVFGEDEFNETYQKAPEAWFLRLKIEQSSLQEKLEALNPVISQTIKPVAMTEKQWELLNRQWFHMTQYNQILIERIAEAEQQ
ncbi:crAss001_48 related protein [Acinetobacter ursingii]|uniref:crAss001_48 related protein n=1 Tax=Acinetobacter ursingii TaxID=108980 RepID=UPI00124FE9E9|nr:hypothetical protein [Acinetobacter ursingii]